MRGATVHCERTDTDQAAAQRALGNYARFTLPHLNSSQNWPRPSARVCLGVDGEVSSKSQSTLEESQ